MDKWMFCKWVKTDYGYSTECGQAKQGYMIKGCFCPYCKRYVIADGMRQHRRKKKGLVV